MSEEHPGINWTRLAERNLEMATTALWSKIQGVNTPSEGGGVMVSPSSVSVWSSQNLMPYLLVGMAIIGAVMIFKK